MAEQKYVFKFDNFLLDAAKRHLSKDGKQISLTPKAFDTLLVLVREMGNVVEKDDLLKEVWPDTFVEESTLAQNIFILRKALGKRGDTTQFIQTVPRHGYRFTAEVQTLVDDCAAVNIRMDKSHSSWGLTRSRLLIGGLLLTTFLVTGWVAIKPNLFVSSVPGAVSSMQIRRLTTSGNVMRAATSDDNSYVAYVVEEGGQQSLWLQQTDATTKVQIMSPREVIYRGITFSRDGASLFFVQYDSRDPVGKLFQIPVLGGTPRLVLSDIDTGISFSPDGNRFAFFRDDFRTRKTTLITAATSGAGEHKLVVYPGPFYGDGPAWSPDGKTIAYPIYPDGDPNRNKGATLMALKLEDGTEHALTAQRWDSITSVGWLGGDRLLLVALDDTTEVLSSQLWQVSLIDGSTRRITNDLNSYSGLGVSPAANAIITIQVDRIADFWIADVNNPANAIKITSGIGDKDGELLGVEWASNERIVFGSSGGGNPNIWSINADGEHRKQLTLDPHTDFHPTVSLLDGAIVFVSKRTGNPHLWQMDSHGQNLKQITDGNTEGFPSFSPDGKWLVYISVDKDEATLWKLFLETAEQKQLTNKFTWMPRVSPNGKSIACFYDDRTASPTRIAIIPAVGGPPTKLVDISPAIFMKAGVRWSPDGKSLTYIVNDHEVSNLWSQPIDGGAGRQLTRFNSSQIFRFAWSPDGKRIALERGTTRRDVILIKYVAQTTT